MEKKTGRSRKAVQSLKPKKLVYWAVAIPAFLALLLFAIVFLDHSDNDISRAGIESYGVTICRPGRHRCVAGRTRKPF